MEFNFIELKKFTKAESQLETVAEKWIYFLQHAGDLDRVPSSANTPALKAAYEVAAQHTWTREELDIYEAQEFKIAVNQNVIETARMDGITQGLAQGAKAKALAIAKGMLAKNIDLATIAELTELTELTQEEIQNLL